MIVALGEGFVAVQRVQIYKQIDNIVVCANVCAQLKSDVLKGYVHRVHVHRTRSNAVNSAFFLHKIQNIVVLATILARKKKYVWMDNAGRAVLLLRPRCATVAACVCSRNDNTAEDVVMHAEPMSCAYKGNVCVLLEKSAVQQVVSPCRTIAITAVIVDKNAQHITYVQKGAVWPSVQ
ncbi:MAG: hypothetical protein AAGJ35_05270 [Myxococcota bacterium]